MSQGRQLYGLCQLITLEPYLNFSLMMANVKGIKKNKQKQKKNLCNVF